MPSESQIVPKWKQPHVETIINDNTRFTDERANPEDNLVKFLAVFQSSKGVDNTLVKITNLKDFKKTFGESNYKLFGQPLMMPIAELATGNASVQCMRIMPEDSTYANSIMCAAYKMDKTTKKMQVKWTSKFIKTAKTQSELDAEFSVLNAAREPDADGFVTIPMFIVRPSGRGKYGNFTRFRVARNIVAEKDYGIKMFTFNAISAENGLQSVANYTGTMVTSPKYNQSVFINDVIDESVKGTTFLDIRVDETNFEYLYNEFAKFLSVDLVDALATEKDPLPDVDCFDIFFGFNVATSIKHKNIEILTTASLVIDAPDGIPMLGGSDGAFDKGEAADAAILKAYQNAFDGTNDKSILSPKRTPIDVMLDANYPFEVKEALYALALLRQDAVLHLDSGFIRSIPMLETVAKSMLIFNDRIASKEAQFYQTRDPITMKKIDVTTTYFMAQNLANHIKVNGNHIPFVKQYATLSGHVDGSLLPAIELCDMELKELLNDNRINYYEAVAENVYVRSIQNTAQPFDSDLLEENNMRVLLEAKRIVEYDCTANLYNFANAEERKRFKDYEDAKFANWRKRKLQTFEIRFDMNQWEAERSILHCYIAIQFRTLNKRTIIEIDINKRDATA